MKTFTFLSFHQSLRIYLFSFMHVPNCLTYSHNNKGKENSLRSPDKGAYIKLVQTPTFYTALLALGIQHSRLPDPTDPSIEAFLRV